MNINHNLTESDLDKIDVRSPLEHQIQQQEMKDSGWRLDKINCMTVYFYKTGEMKGSIYIKIPLRSNPILNIENIDKYCFLWSILAYLHPCIARHPNRVSNYRKYFNELNIEGFDFTNGFKCSDVHIFNELNNLSINKLDINFYQNQNEWKRKLIPFEVRKNDSDTVIGLAIYKNHYLFFAKIIVLLGDHSRKIFCRRCLLSYTSENMLVLHKQKCEEDNITFLELQMNHIFNGISIFIKIH